MKKFFFFLFLFVVLMGYSAELDWNPAALRPGDVLQIQVFRVSELSLSVRVEADGCFSFPQCGEIQAAGRTTREVARELTEQIGKQIANPYVDVFVSAWAPRTVYILGEVNNSGVSLELPTYNPMTALQAISSAGGFTESADLTNVAVLRRDSNQQNLTRLPIDVTALVSQKSGGDEFILHPEDTLIIPKAPPVYVSGLVNNPGVYYIETQRPPLCSELLVRAGSLAIGADADKIQILRTDDEGKRSTLVVSLKTIEESNFKTDLRIQPGDYIVVNNAEQIFVLGQVKTPGPLTLPVNMKITASRAIFLAGGFTPIAKENDILLIRGQKITTIDLKKMYKDPKKLAEDAELQNGDILFVQESFW
ncbi:MAG: SLBB domain-containing protein [Lentisphaeria bacterium]